MIVAHESQNLFADKDTANKTLDRFEKSVKIELPENMAFRLMAQAMKKTDDPVLLPKWIKYKNSMNDELITVRSTISAASKKITGLSQKTALSDSELQEIVPIHPYAALILKNIAVMFNSNQRSMFDFIISNDMTDAKGFKWYINNYGPMDDDFNLLTVDLLWDFFYEKGRSGLSDDVRGILDNYTLLKSEKLLPDEQRVMKTVLLLQAVSMRVSGNELLVPSARNIDLAFLGTDWSKGKPLNIAYGLIEKGLLFEKPVAGGGSEFCVVNTNATDDIKKYRDSVLNETRTQSLIVTAELKNAVAIPSPVKARYIVSETAESGFTAAAKSLQDKYYPERFKVIVTFAMDDTEAAKLRNHIIKQVNETKNDIIFIESLEPMGQDLKKQYIENMAFSKYHTGKDKAQADHYQKQAVAALTAWRDKVGKGAFNIYTAENKAGVRMATLTDLQNALTDLNHKKYYYGLEQYNLNATMYGVYQLANGAGFGIEEKLAGAYLNKNKNLSFENALSGAWKVPNYWEDPAKQSLVIVHVKKKVDEIVKEGFDGPEGKVSLLRIVDELEKEPFGLMPSALAAFVLGFVLKEYAAPEYSWSNKLNSETMTVDKMKTAIANALQKKVNPNSKYKEEFIVTMTPEVRRFLSFTSAVFRIPDPGSVENAGVQIRIRMKSLTFPIWCLKYILPDAQLESSEELVSQVIDAYTGIANTANVAGGSESELAENIGRIVTETPAVEADLERLMTGDNCRKGMLAYIAGYRDGLLKNLAEQIGDGGNYLDEVKSKFSAVDANWVWNTSTADEKISDVILEYQIILESSKSLGKYLTLKEVVNAWNSKTNQIRIPCEAVAKSTGDLGPFLWQLCYIKQSGGLSEQNKQKFYDLLLTQREAFDAFYRNQLPYFEQDADAFLGDLEEVEKAELFSSFPSGQFTKSRTEYYKFVQAEVDKFLQTRVKNSCLINGMRRLTPRHRQTGLTNIRHRFSACLMIPSAVPPAACSALSCPPARAIPMQRKPLTGWTQQIFITVSKTKQKETAAS